MSAHPPKAVTLSHELVARFALYLYRLDPDLSDPPIKDWGCFHASLRNPNGPGQGHLGPVAPWGLEPLSQWSAEERALVPIYDGMTPSQRRRLCLRAEVLTVDEIKTMRRFAERKAEAAAALDTSDPKRRWTQDPVANPALSGDRK